MQLNPEIVAYLDRRATLHLRTRSQEIQDLLVSARSEDVDEHRAQILQEKAARTALKLQEQTARTELKLAEIEKREALRIRREEERQRLRDEARERRKKPDVPVDTTDYRDMNAPLPPTTSIRHVRSDNPTGFKGVEPYARGFRAVLYHDGRRTPLGTYPTAEEAARVYDHSARAMFGSIALLNFPESGELSARYDDVPLAELTAPPRPLPPAADEVPAGSGPEPEGAA